MAVIGRPPRPIAERFSKMWAPEPNSGCWIWLGQVSNRGYGQIRAGGDNGKRIAAHRVAYESLVGEIPDEMCVLHKCDVRCCVNPDHLFLGTVAANQIDMARKARGRRGRYKYGAWQEPGGRWSARVRAYGKQVFVGTFDTEEEATAAATAFRSKYVQEFVQMVQSQLTNPGMRFSGSMRGIRREERVN